MSNRLNRLLFRPPSHSALGWLLIGAGVFDLLVFAVLAIISSVDPYPVVKVLGVTFSAAPRNNINVLRIGLVLLLLGIAESLPTARTTLAGNLRTVALVLAIVVAGTSMSWLLRMVADRM